MKHPSHDQWRKEYKKLWPGSSSMEASASVFIKVQKIFREYTTLDPALDLGTPVRASCVLVEIYEDDAPAIKRGILSYALWMMKQDDEDTHLFGVDVGALALELGSSFEISRVRRPYFESYLEDEIKDIREIYHLAALNIKDWLKAGGYKASPFLYWHFRAA